MSFFAFDQLPRELRGEIMQHCTIQTLGRFVQTNTQNEVLISNTIWQKKIEEIDPSIWRKLKKATRKGDLKLLCAIVVCSNTTCSCHWSMPIKHHLKTAFLLHLDALFTVPAQNALLCYLLSYSRHGSYGALHLKKSIGMRTGDVLLTHRKIKPWMERNLGGSRFSLRLFLHGYFMVTYCFGMRWKVDPLFVRNQQVFSKLTLCGSQLGVIPFNPKTKSTKTGTRFDTKHKFYSIEAIKKMKLSCQFNGQEIAPNDLYYLFDYARLSITTNQRACPSFDRIPVPIQEWLMNDGLKVRGYPD